ncbi:MAG: F0F1 ATP synthase subunit A [Bacteroidales bacterium]|nr:F0F1 ATP synthase subunit A [Bacteroidales bacterium]
MKIRFFVSVLLCLFFTVPVFAEETAEEGDKLNVSKLIFEHTGDSYEWHMFSIGEKDIAIPLPLILISKTTGIHAFMSSKLEETGSFAGFTYGSEEGKYAGKMVEINADGEEMRPFDMSITKNVLGIFINCALLLWIVLSVARWYKKNPDGVPKGFRGIVDLLIMDVNDNIIKCCVGENYRKFAPYLLTAFFFIFLSNIIGLVPIFPGGANITGNIAVTFTLAMMTFIMVNVFGTKEYWKDILWPDVPIFLKAPAPIMPIIELFGIFTKPFALMVRLFANILAGHAIVIGLCCLVFITASMGAAVNGSMTFVSVLFMVFMDCLELLVAYIQAYVFTMLSSVFIGLAQAKAIKKRLTINN